MSALVAAVALAALSSGAGATSKCEVVLGTATFTDATADGTPDISQVVATTYEDGNTQFQIALPGTSEFTADMLVRTYLDVDRDAATGSDKGFEYMIQSVPAGTLWSSRAVLDQVLPAEFGTLRLERDGLGQAGH